MLYLEQTYLTSKPHKQIYMQGPMLPVTKFLLYAGCTRMHRQAHVMTDPHPARHLHSQVSKLGLLVGGLCRPSLHPPTGVYQGPPVHVLHLPTAICLHSPPTTLSKQQTFPE